ncbi:MAG: quinone-dependent dihydroorotate dehydrogenase [Bacteroidota bacterium]
MLYRLLKPVLFSFSPERAHHLTVKLLEFASSLPGARIAFRALYEKRDAALRRQCFGLDFPNPVGLAAGFDKDGRYYRPMSNLGFGFIEIGTVTPRPQAGNPQPRLFRLPKDQGLINRMGFNNEGVDAMVERLKAGKPANLIIGGNIGKNKDTPNERAIDDYLICFDKLFDYVDYFVVNVSSPNTPNLRDLQEKEPLTALLTTLQERNQTHAQPKPILLKIAPDLTDGQLDDIVEIAQQTQLAGLIATNTTISRDGLTTSQARIEEIGNGGLSGVPVRERATEVIRYLAEKSNGQIPIVGVGGIRNGQDAVEKLNAGACLVQVYSGMVYAGPGLVREICEAVLKDQKS